MFCRGNGVGTADLALMIKYTMRFDEFKTIKHIVPLSPAQARLNALRQGVKKSRTALQAERDSQRRQRDRESMRKQQATAPTLGKPSVHTATAKSHSAKTR